MTMPDITGALEARLGKWAIEKGIAVACDNIQFDPPSGATYLVSNDMPATPYSIDLAGKAVVYPGVYQVNIVARSGDGKSGAKSIATQVAELFPENSEIAGEGFSVWITSPPAIFRGITDAVSYTVPVSINYRVHVSQ